MAKREPRGRWVWFCWSSSYAYRVKLVRWVRKRMATGREDTNKIGTGAIIWSDWMFYPPQFNRRSRHKLPVGYYYLRPFDKLYRRDPQYRYGPNHKLPPVVQRPSVDSVPARGLPVKPWSKGNAKKHST